MAVARIGIERDIAQEADVRHLFLDGAEGRGGTEEGIDFVLFDYSPFCIGDSKLKNRFGQTNGHNSIHSGLLTLKTDPHPQCEPVRLIPRKKAGESVPSLQRIACGAS